MMRAEMQELIDMPVSAKELTTAKESLVNSFVFAFANSHAIVKRQQRLDFYAYPTDYMQTYRQKIAAVTAEDVQRVAKQYLRPDQLQIVLVGRKAEFEQDPAAALGMVQLGRADEFLARRTEIANRFNDAFEQLPGCRLPSVADWATHAWHLYILRLDPDVVQDGRDGLIADLGANGLGSSVHFIPLHHHPAFADEGAAFADKLPETEKYFQRAVSLPLFPGMSDQDVDDVINVVTKSINSRASG